MRQKTKRLLKHNRRLCQGVPRHLHLDKIREHERSNGLSVKKQKRSNFFGAMFKSITG